LREPTARCERARDTAHENLRAQILLDRLRYGLADLVEPR
jgi:hypothetical protein